MDICNINIYLYVCVCMYVSVCVNVLMISLEVLTKFVILFAFLHVCRVL